MSESPIIGPTGGIIGALGFGNLGYLFVIPLATLLLALSGLNWLAPAVPAEELGTRRYAFQSG